MRLFDRIYNYLRGLKVHLRSYFYLFLQLWRSHPLRSLLSSLGVMCGVASVVAMLTIGEGGRQETLRQIGQLGLENVIIRSTAVDKDHTQINSSENELQPEGREAIDSLGIFAHTASVKNLAWQPDELQQKLGVETLAVDPVYAKIYGLLMAEGRFLHQDDIDERRKLCVLGNDVAQSLPGFSGIGQTLTLMGEIFTVVGRLAPVQWSASKTGGIQARNYNLCIFIPATVPEDRGLSEIVARVSPGLDLVAAGEIVERVLDLASKGMNQSQIIIPLALLNQAEKSQHLFNIILGSIAAISLLVGGIGIMNIMLASVAERTPEIGLRRAVGATKNDIMLQFLIEALVIGLIGGSTGLILGVIGSILVSSAAGWPTALNIFVLLVPMTMSVVVTGAAGLYPAYLASQVDPIIALRQSPW